MENLFDQIRILIILETIFGHLYYYWPIFDPILSWIGKFSDQTKGTTWKSIPKLTKLGGINKKKIFFRDSIWDMILTLSGFFQFCRNFARKFFFPRIEFRLLMGSPFHPIKDFSYLCPWRMSILSHNTSSHNLWPKWQDMFHVQNSWLWVLNIFHELSNV